MNDLFIAPTKPLIRELYTSTRTLHRYNNLIMNIK